MAFIQQESLPRGIQRSISKFNQYIERDKFLRGDTDYIAVPSRRLWIMAMQMFHMKKPELIAAEKKAIKNRLKRPIYYGPALV